MPGGLDVRIVGECDGDGHVPLQTPHQAVGHVEDRVEPVMLRDSHDHLAGAYHLAGLGAGGGRHARGVCRQPGVAELVLGIVYLGCGRIDRSFRGQECFLRKSNSTRVVHP